MQCRFSGDEGEAARFLVAFQTDFHILPVPLQETLRRDARLRKLSSLLHGVRITECGEWAWTPGLFGEVNAISFATLLQTSWDVQVASVEGIWDYAMPCFGTPVYKSLGLRVMDDRPFCRISEIRKDISGFSVMLHQVKGQYPLTWEKNGELTCLLLCLAGFTVESPTWASCVAFFRDLRIAECVLTFPNFLIPDLSQLVAGYIVPLDFYKTYQDMSLKSVG